MITKNIKIGICLLCFLSINGCGGNNSNNNPIVANDDEIVVSDLSNDTYFDIRIDGPQAIRASDMQQLDDNSFVVLATTDDDIFLVRISSIGELMWKKRIGEPGYEKSESLALSSDGNIVMVGITSSNKPNKDIYLIKLNLDGDIIWEKTFDTGRDDISTDLIAVSDGYVICGYSYVPYFDSDFYIAKTDLDGNLDWETIYGEPNYSEQAYDIVQSSNDGYFVVGRKRSNRYGGFILKLDSQGNDISERLILNPDFSFWFTNIVQSIDGNYVITGEEFCCGNIINLLKIDESLNTIWEQNYFPDDAGVRYPRDIIANSDGTFAVTGDYDSYIGTLATEIAVDGTIIDNYVDSIYEPGYPKAIIATENGYAIAGDILNGLESFRGLYIVEFARH